MNQNKVSENRAYKVTLILLLSLAAFTTAMKELNRLHQMVSSVHSLARQWRGSDLAKVNEKSISIDESCPLSDSSLTSSSSDSHLSGLIAAATDGYIERMEYEAICEPEVGVKVDLIAGKKANRPAPQSSRSKFTPAKNLKEEMAGIPRDGSWPSHFEFKALDRRVTLALPMTMVADTKIDSFHYDIPPDLVGLLSKINRKQSQDKTETRRRELMIKRFERSISSRRAS